MLKSSMPTSRAPGVARKLAGRRPSKTRSPYAKSCMTQDAIALRPANGLVEQALRGRCGRRVRRVVQVHRIGRGVEAAERHAGRTRERDGREVVGIAGVGQDDRAATLDRAERELHQSRLRARQHRHLAGGIQLDAVEIAIARSDRFLESRAGLRRARTRGRRDGRPSRRAHARRAPAGQPRGCRDRGR